MHIKNMPPEQRPMEKLLFAGPAALTNGELLAIMLRSGTREKSAVSLAEEVLDYASSETGGLGRADPHELMKIDGIGVTKACTIVASVELVKRLMSERIRGRSPKMECMDDVAYMLMQELKFERREVLMALFLNTRLRVESKKIISIGTLDSALFHPREVLGPAVSRSASAVILAHNHPSGEVDPSREDISVTMRLADASNTLGIRFLDHLIIGEGCYTSMKSEGYIN